MQSNIQYKGPLTSVPCKIGKPDHVQDDEEYELMRELCSLLPNFSTTIEAVEREFLPIYMLHCYGGACYNITLRCSLMIVAVFLLLKENEKNKFDFRFPRDDLMMIFAFLDLETFKINEIDECLSLLDGSRTRREFFFKMVKPLVLVLYHISCPPYLFNQHSRSLHFNLWWAF